MREMFQKMVVEKDASLIPHYYHREFLLFTNGQEIDFSAFLRSHEEYYASPIQYSIEYDEETLMEVGESISPLVIQASHPKRSKSC